MTAAGDNGRPVSSGGDWFSRVESVFHGACAQAEGERDAWVLSVCEGDTKLVAAVRQLLAADSSPPTFLQDEALGKVATDVLETPETEQSTDDTCIEKIAGCDIVRRVGTGGMGTVFEAQQHHPTRTVAIKLMRPGVLSTIGRHRFEREAEILARLTHPAIATLFEAGVHDDGFGPAPYAIMEFVPGARTIVDAAFQEGRSRQSVLELFRTAADAIHHGHQRGVIHRDIKPDNVLVDESGNVKVIDFGVARVTGRDTAAETMTAAGALVGTLAYMSPEQCDPDQDVDIRADVYALGILLFEMLTGHRPLPSDRSLPQMIQTILHRPPDRVTMHDRTLAGDLDAIVARAIEKDPADRYQSAALLAADVEAHLAGHPVQALRHRRWYVTRRFIKRHRRALGIAAVIALAGIVGGTIFVKSEIDRRVTDLVNNALLKRDEVMDDFTDSRASDQELEALSTTTVDSTRSPRHTADLLFMEGRSYIKRSDFEEAKVALTSAFDIRVDLFGADSLEVAEIQHELGRAHYFLSEIDDAETSYRKAVETRRRTGRPLALAESLHHLAACLRFRGKYDGAFSHYDEALQIRQTHLPGDSREVTSSLNSLALITLEMGQYDAAEGHLLDVLAAVQTQDVSERFIGRSLRNLAAVRLAQGNATAARTALEESRTRTFAVTEPDHRDRAITDLAFARWEFAAGTLDAARASAARAHQLLESRFPRPNRELADVECLLARIAIRRGDPSAARSLLEKVRTAREALLPGNHPDQIEVLLIDGMIASREGDQTRAAAILDVAQMTLSPELPETHPIHAEIVRLRDSIGSGTGG